MSRKWLPKGGKDDLRARQCRVEAEWMCKNGRQQQRFLGREESWVEADVGAKQQSPSRALTSKTWRSYHGSILVLLYLCIWKKSIIFFFITMNAFIRIIYNTTIRQREKRLQEKVKFFFNMWLGYFCPILLILNILNVVNLNKNLLSQMILDLEKSRKRGKLSDSVK